jgi:phosphate transport system substrate-binding protein
MKRSARLCALLAAGLAAPPALAQAPHAGGPVWAQWLVPAEPSHKPQTDAEAEQGRQKGRALPTPEVLQPTLDPTLAPYRKRTDIALKGRIHGAASDVLADLSQRWAAAFTRIYPDVQIDIPPPYAGSLGANELAEGGLDFVFVSRELRPADITKFKGKFGYDPTSVPILGGTWRHFGFLDAVAFCVNPDNPISQLSYDQLDRILSSTHARGGEPITEWGQLGLTGAWTHAPIHIYGVKPWNGFEEFVRQRVLSAHGARGEWRDGIEYSPTVFAQAGKIAQDKYALGYTGLAYLDAPVKVLPLTQTADGPAVPPTYEAVASASYGLARLSFFNFNQRPDTPADPVLAEFLRFVRSRDGQQIALDQATFLPLRASQVQQTESLLRSAAR